MYVGKITDNASYAKGNWVEKWVLQSEGVCGVSGEKGGGAKQTSAVACCPLLLLTCALLMTSSHSEVTIHFPPVSPNAPDDAKEGGVHPPSPQRKVIVLLVADDLSNIGSVSTSSFLNPLLHVCTRRHRHGNQRAGQQPTSVGSRQQ